MRRWVMAAAALVAVGCGQKAPAPSATAAANAGPERAPFDGCAWTEVSGAGLKLWTQTCADREQLAPAPDGKGFVLTFKDGAAPKPAIRVFDKPGAGGLEAVAAAALAEGAAPAGATCALELAPEGLPVPAGRTRYQLAPTGQTKAAWDRATENPEIKADTPPCGALGVSLDGERYFEVHATRPDIIVFVEHGFEAQIYDPASVTALPAN